jgi:hypothetical protein
MLPLLLISALSASSGVCGRITEFDIAPRRENLHGLRIIKIDGKYVANDIRSPPRLSHRLTPGTHTLVLAEEIDPHWLSRYSLSMQRERHKTLLVDVPVDTTVYLAAKLISSDSYRKNYWEPVAWKTKAAVCP